MWEVRFSEAQHEVLIALIRSQGHRGPSLTGALEALELARWDELPEATLPWPEIDQACRMQGITEADAIWDACGQHPEPAVSPLPRRT